LKQRFGTPPTKKLIPRPPFAAPSLFASSSTASSVDPIAKSTTIVADQSNVAIESSSSFLKRLFSGTLLRNNREKQAMDLIVDEAAVRAYYQCADGPDYVALCKGLHLNDVMFTWYKLTLLHLWMVCIRAHRSLNQDSYLRFRDGILIAMWDDVEGRFGTLAEEWKIKMGMKKKENLRIMHGLMIQALVEYDEGFLCSDTMLAGALWRNLYTEQVVDLIHLNRAVRYVRANIAHLDTLHIDTLIVDGIKEWKLP